MVFVSWGNMVGVEMSIFMQDASNQHAEKISVILKDPWHERKLEKIACGPD